MSKNYSFILPAVAPKSMSNEALLQALAYVRWQAFGECRSAGWEGPPPTAAELEAVLVAAIALQAP